MRHVDRVSRFHRYVALTNTQSPEEIAQAQGWTVSKLIAEIDGSRQYGNLSSAIRSFVPEHFRAKSNFTQSDSRQTESQIAD